MGPLYVSNQIGSELRYTTEKMKKMLVYRLGIKSGEVGGHKHSGAQLNNFGRVAELVEGTCLENMHGGNPIGGSNPPSSARRKYRRYGGYFLERKRNKAPVCFVWGFENAKYIFCFQNAENTLHRAGEKWDGTHFARP